MQMESSQKLCRICFSESEFNTSLYGTYCRRTNMIEKILICLNIIIESREHCSSICFKCADNIEKHYEFIMYVKKCQSKPTPRPSGESLNRRITVNLREQVIEADATFSFIDKFEENQKPKASSPLFSYFSPPTPQPEPAWKAPRELGAPASYKRKTEDKSRRLSRDIFESQSQDAEDASRRSGDWKLTPNDNILKRVRNKFFGRSEF